MGNAIDEARTKKHIQKLGRATFDMLLPCMPLCNAALFPCMRESIKQDIEL
jgi:hypothetical protein